jgi:hypothetical protein
LTSVQIIGGEFLVTATPTRRLSGREITALEDGRFVVTWYANYSDDSTINGDTRGRVFAADGTPAGDEFIVNTTVALSHGFPEITALSGGGFVVTWHSFKDDWDADIRARVFRADGTPAGADFLINTTTNGVQDSPRITALAGGGFVVTWNSDEHDPGTLNGDIRGRVFAADGTAGPDFLVNTTMAGEFYEPEITALTDGGFVVTWTSVGGFRGRVFAADGGPAGDDFLVNTTTAGDQSNQKITALAAGGFIMTWYSYDVGTANWDICGRVFTADGRPASDDFLVNATTDGLIFPAEITPLAGGGFVVMWSYDPDSDPGT